MTGSLTFDQQQLTKLPNRLAYVLRYGAEKEGLNTTSKGYVNFSQLLKSRLIKIFSSDEVMEHLKCSESFQGKKRYDLQTMDGQLMVRAAYGRSIERHPCHHGTHVRRLMEQCMDTVCNNLNIYDMQDFQDEHLLNLMIHRLKRSKRLNRKAMEILLNAHIENLSLENIMLTETMAKIVSCQCQFLKVLSLRNCGYVVTDHLLNQLLKKLPMLTGLNLSRCHHITDLTVNTVCKYSPNLKLLNMCHCPNISENGVLKLVGECQKLTHLYIYDNPNISVEGRVTLSVMADCRWQTLFVFLHGFMDYCENEMEHFKLIW